MTSDAIEAAFRAACADELEAAKPGNVHVHADGHRMTVEDFRRSAEAAAGPVCAPGATLGQRVLGAVTATRQAVGQNTNLGIVLLCAPLAMAAGMQAADLPARVTTVLASTDLADANAVFQAIALAAPGGLGTAPRYDVRGPATVGLELAMTEAAPRDRIAHQYVTGFADIFGPLAAAYRAALGRGADRAGATLAVYFRCLASWPDSHVARKHGPALAHSLQVEAAAWENRLGTAPSLVGALPALLTWDAELKRRDINPGTSADLTVATIFAERLRDGLPLPRDDG